MAVKLQSGQIPQNPGVYFFKNSNGKILYIGKAGNLRSRLSSYFQNSKNTPPKTKSLVEEAVKVDWDILNSEIEALIKEAELIKKHRPKYNILMRDDKNYLYVAFSKEDFPKIFLTHQPRRPDYIGGRGSDRSVGAQYIGPFTEVGPIKSTLKMLRRTFPYCTCKKPHKRPCLNSRLGRCLGVCCLGIPRNPAQSFSSFSPAQPRAPRVAKPFRSASAESMPKSQQNPLKDSSDFSALEYNKNISAIKKILSGKNKKLANGLKQEMKKLSKAQKYEEAGKVRDQVRALERIFEHRGVIKQELTSENQKALNSMSSLLKIENINRIEAYDIANIQGKFAYGSMAVFENGKINKDEYRIFKINSVYQSDDPAMLKEVLTRRFNHPEWNFPHVIIVDGGKPQMNAAITTDNLASKNRLALPRNKSELNSAARAHTYNFYPQDYRSRIIALTKNKKHIGDHIFISGQANPVSLDRLPSPLKNLILQLDSEAHRFAISYYRKLHKKSLLT